MAARPPPLAAFLAAWALRCCLAESPLRSFRPPSVPLITQSPLVNVWSNADRLHETVTTQWSGTKVDAVAMAKVDGEPYLLMGRPSWWNEGKVASQTGLVVFATQTAYAFELGSTGVSLNLTFTSPLLTDDWELLSRPAHYASFAVASARGAEVELYFDVTGHLVMEATAEASFGSLDLGSARGPLRALHLGAAEQRPLSSTKDAMTWGVAYLLAAPGDEAKVGYANDVRGAFAAGRPGKPAPSAPAPLVHPSPPLPVQGPNAGWDVPGADLPSMPVELKPEEGWQACWAKCNATAGCKAWAASSRPGCDGDAGLRCWLKGAYPAAPAVRNDCRISGVQAGARDLSKDEDALVLSLSRKLGALQPGGTARWHATLAVDELGTVEWFGEFCPPYWRRALARGSAPTSMLVQAHEEYAAVLSACDAFDRRTAAELAAAGGDKYATLAQLTYRQVFGAMQLAWIPSKKQPWYFLKEISSDGDLNTADVVYPAFPQVLYYSPELLRLMQVSHLEYAMNFTSQPYPLPFAPHDLGFWPIADISYKRQENMPLEESAWAILSFAIITQSKGGDATWLAPYWPVVQTWFTFMRDLLPFPQTQLSTDDFDGLLYNSTNLAVKGLAALAAYGYLVEAYLGDKKQAAEIYATAAAYANTMVQHSWLEDGANSHFLLGYLGSQGDGGDRESWPMLYNALWLRLLGYDNLLPRQQQLLDQMRDWYAARKLQKFGLPLNSRKNYTKDDWTVFLAATYYSAGEDGAGPQPSAFSTTLFDRFYAWANATSSRVPISDWSFTDQPASPGFIARPVYGAMYAPMLVHSATRLGLGPAAQAERTALAARTFSQVHELAQTQKGPACAASGPGRCPVLDAWRRLHRPEEHHFV